MTTDHAEPADASTDDHLLAPSVRAFPWLPAGLAAVATLLVEYLVIAAIFVVGPSSVDRGAAPINAAGDVAIQYGHVLFNAHHVPTVTRATIQIGGSPFGNDLYFATGASVPPVVFFLVPVVALFAAGALFETYRPGTPAESILEESALVGTGVTVGYVLCGVVGTFVLVQRWALEVQEETVGTATQRPLLSVTLVAFFLFPMVLVTLGAATAASRRSSTDDVVGPPGDGDAGGESGTAGPGDDDQA
ncbi:MULTISPECIES: hypothetical protein [Haloarcula]|uniref:hypothetical protein n=1 Tax=Haloarcula TaxID=2237 RepID=UPI0023ECDB17|nr:hypothetical protein [Halomicroarcula sp. XH51]